ncbi:hypothetical protein J6590_061622 [Homalodisca vitripennis]|nr:hypothetical protein J6590_061622 [Homalodisca vitripennis]
MLSILFHISLLQPPFTVDASRNALSARRDRLREDEIALVRSSGIKLFEELSGFVPPLEHLTFGHAPLSTISTLYGQHNYANRIPQHCPTILKNGYLPRGGGGGRSHIENCCCKQ